RVIHVKRMCKLVNHQILHDGRTLEHQAAVETDGPARGTAAPAGSLPANENSLILVTQLLRKPRERRLQHSFSALQEPPAQSNPHRAAIRTVAAQSQQFVSELSEPDAVIAARQMHLPDLVTRGKLDARWGKGRSRAGTASGLLAFTLDPTAMPGYKALDGGGRRARGYDDFHTAGVKHAHGEAACPAALAHDPSLGAILLGP